MAALETRSVPCMHDFTLGFIRNLHIDQFADKSASRVQMPIIIGIQIFQNSFGRGDCRCLESCVHQNHIVSKSDRTFLHTQTQLLSQPSAKASKRFISLLSKNQTKPTLR